MMLRDAWYRHMPGLMALTEEKAVLNRVLQDHRNAVLLQIGGPADARLLENVSASHVIFLDQVCRTHHEKPYVQAHLTKLPIETDSIDTVILVHTLEFTQTPQTVLEEVYRILKPGGKMIVYCFNRWSLWNVMHLFGRKKVFPKAGRCYSLHFLKKYLYAMDAEIIVSQTLCFRPPFLSHDSAKKWLFLETLGQMIVPYLGAIALVVATKKVSEATPLIEWSAVGYRWSEVRG